VEVISGESAANIGGSASDWQATLKSGKTKTRLVVTITKDANGAWNASEVTPNDGSNPSVGGDKLTSHTVLEHIRGWIAKHRP
jgi:hypothetical protein